MKLKLLFGTAATLMAGAAIGGGVMISHQAMATSTPSKATESVTIGLLGKDGVGIQCKFSGADAQKLLQEPATADGATAIPVGSIGAGKSISGVAVAPSEDVASSGVAIAVEASTGEATMVGAPTLRDGTPEECAAAQSGLEADSAGNNVVFVMGATVPADAAGQNGATVPAVAVGQNSTP